MVSSLYPVHERVQIKIDMTIKKLFPVHVLIQDDVLEDSLNDELTVVISAIQAQHATSQSKFIDDEVSLFTQSNLELFPSLLKLIDVFTSGFFELATTFENNTLTRDDIESKVRQHMVKLPFMQSGDYKRIHNHIKSSAHAILYLSDVDNARHGGQLILHDPAFHSNYEFRNPSTYAINTTRNRLIVSPSYIWHEVTPYTGSVTRMAVVMNLDL